MRARLHLLPVLPLGLAACHSPSPPAAPAAPPPAAMAAAAPAPTLLAPPPPPDDERRAEGDMWKLEEDAPPPPIVVAHNRVRAEHCAPPLQWSDALAAEAQAWADHLAAAGCRFEHSQTDHGENLAAGTSGALDPDAVVAMWAREEEKYDYKKAGFSMATGHFTQVVWKDSQAIGCGVATCRGLDTWVCNYDPPGNVEGDYALNVAPRGCR